MTLAFSLTAMVLLNWISVETAAKVYLVIVTLTWLQLFVEALRERRPSADR